METLSVSKKKEKRPINPDPAARLEIRVLATASRWTPLLLLLLPRVALTSGRVHGGEVEQVSQGSAALAWWSADAESDSQLEEGGVVAGVVVVVVSQGKVGGVGGSPGWWEKGGGGLSRSPSRAPPAPGDMLWLSVAGAVSQPARGGATCERN